MSSSFTNTLDHANFFFPDITILEQQAKLVDTQAVLKLETDDDLHPAAIALALLRDDTISTSEISAAAKDRISARIPQLHTLALLPPVYLFGR